MTPKEIAIAAVKALDSKKGQDIKCLETGHLTTLADYFVLCTATSTTQIKALADVCEKMLKDAGEPPHHVEGHRGGTWILLDFSSVVVHIFKGVLRPGAPLERRHAGGSDRCADRELKSMTVPRNVGSGALFPHFFGFLTKQAFQRPGHVVG